MRFGILCFCESEVWNSIETKRTIIYQYVFFIFALLKGKEMSSKEIKCIKIEDFKNTNFAVDYVDEDFDKTEGFEWLMKNAENFGFILRYKKEKQDITKVSYEPWHWRFVGQEHCLQKDTERH